MIDHALQHNTSLQNADRGISDLLGSGSSILTSLRDQRLTLKVCLLLVWLLSRCEHAGWGFGNGLKKKTISFYWHFIKVSFLRDFWHTISYSLFHLKQTKSSVYTYLTLVLQFNFCNFPFHKTHVCSWMKNIVWDEPIDWHELFIRVHVYFQGWHPNHVFWTWKLSPVVNVIQMKVINETFVIINRELIKEY